MSLTLIPSGHTARVVVVRADRDLASRLSALGLCAGGEVDVLRNSGRDPLLVAVKGSRLMIDRSTAAHISVLAAR